MPISAGSWGQLAPGRGPFNLPPCMQKVQPFVERNRGSQILLKAPNLGPGMFSVNFVTVADSCDPNLLSLIVGHTSPVSLPLSEPSLGSGTWEKFCPLNISSPLTPACCPQAHPWLGSVLGCCSHNNNIAGPLRLGSCRPHLASC